MSATKPHYQALGSCVVVFNKNANILLGKRQNAYKSGYYGLPGGRIEPGEAAEVAARRELEEETGLKALNLRMIGVVKEWQERWFFVHFGYTCSDWEGEVQTKEDTCEGWDWYARTNLPLPILPGHKAIIDLIQSTTSFVEI